MRVILEKCIAKEKAVEKGLKAVQNMKVRVLSKVSEVNKRVDSFICEQVKVLEEHRAHLKHEATTRGQVKVKQLESQADDLSSLLVQLRSAIDFTSQAIEDGDDIKLLSLKTQLVQRLSQLNSSQDQLKPCRNDYMKLQVKRSIKDEGELAQVMHTQCDPNKCTISTKGEQGGYPRLIRIDQIMYFTLIIKDGSGVRVTEGGHKVSVQVNLDPQSSMKLGTKFATTRQKRENEVWRELVAQDNGDGSYSFNYCPKQRGFVSISVMVEGQPIKGSPFKWQINQASYWNCDEDY